MGAKDFVSGFGNELKNMVVGSYVEDWQNGRRWRAIGRGTAFALPLFLGGIVSAVGKVGKAGEAASVAGKGGEAGEMVGLAEGVGITQRTFASLDKLLQHFGKHSAEFGYKTPSEYLIGAQKLTSGGEEILTYIRPGGGKLFYNPSTNEFAILSKEGI